MVTYTASRVTFGNLFFPEKIIVDSNNVTLSKKHFFGYKANIIPRKNIGAISIDAGLFFGDITFETLHGKKIQTTGFNKASIKSLVSFLSPPG
ncbi:MAG: PH domain-containing protein [Treponema sp.]|nr:PH domain-containing protein [Treponema sp.]